MTRTILYIIIGVIVVSILLVGANIISEDVDNNNMPSEFDRLFQEKLTFLGVERVGQPIEGFNAFILQRAFPGFTDEDFDGVGTLEGHYEFVDGSIEYKRGRGMPITSAEQTVSSEGYATLLINVSQRLDIKVADEESVEQIVDLLSKDETTFNNASTNCAPEQRNVDACIEIYQPVCAKVNVQCVTTPCEPVEETFPNSCFACSNSLVESYIVGECAK